MTDPTQGTLADFFNAPTEFTLDGETFHVRQPDQVEQGTYQRWLEQLAYDSINGRAYQSDADRERALDRHDTKCAAGVYEWGGAVSVQRLTTAKGLAKLLSIVCRDQGLTEKKAERLVDQEQRKLAAILVSRVTSDPLALAAALATLGLPSDYLSSASATSPSAPPPTSPPSAAAPMTS